MAKEVRENGVTRKRIFVGVVMRTSCEMMVSSEEGRLSTSGIDSWGLEAKNALHEIESHTRRICCERRAGMLATVIRWHGEFCRFG